MGLEQYPFHNPEIPTLTKQVLELEEMRPGLDPTLIDQVIARFDTRAINLDIVKRLLNEEAEVLVKMGDSEEDIEEALDLKLRQLGAKKR